MKRYFLSIAIILAALCAASCVKETMSENSVIVVSQTKQNDFDRWLEANFLLPYNIDFKYRFEMNESDMNYFTIPADYEYSIVMAHLVKYLCVETYDEVAGISFTRSYFPKMFFLTGEWEYRNNGTIILGTAAATSRRCSSLPESGSTVTTVPSSSVPLKAARRSSSRA